MIALAVVVASCSTAPPTHEESRTPFPVSSPSQEVIASPAPPGQARLSVIPIAGFSDDDEILAIVEVDGQLIGVGRRGDQGAVWTSLDGASWTLAPGLPVMEPVDYASTTMTSVVEGPGGLVSIGTWQTIDVNIPRIWHSTDGQRWTSVYEPSGFERIEAVAVGGPGYVAVGLASDDGFTGRPQLWTSADGSEWTAVDSQGLDGDLSDIVAGTETLVAVGGSAVVSTDGAAWTAAPEQEALQGAQMTSVAFRNGAFVAAGALIGPGDILRATPAIVKSQDGLHWSVVLRGEPGQRISQVVPFEEGFVAIGGHFPSASWSYDPAAPNPPRDTIQLWFSADGETWSGPITGFLADGGISTLGQAVVIGGDLFLPMTVVNGGPNGPVYQPAILRGTPTVS